MYESDDSFLYVVNAYFLTFGDRLVVIHVFQLVHNGGHLISTARKRWIGGATG